MSDLLVNLKYKNIPEVVKSKKYHSQQKRLHEANKGDKVFFISQNQKTKLHELVGYFLVEKKFLTPENEFGKYCIQAKKIKFSAGRLFNKIAGQLSLGLGRNPSATKIGTSTQVIRILTPGDVKILSKALLTEIMAERS